MSLAVNLHPESKSARSGALRVLVVDDDPIYRETSRMFLSISGRHVTLGANGSEALSHLSQASFDVMIVDMEMPDMTGLEVIAAARKMAAHRDLPIIMVTSRDDSMAIDRAYELGASSFVVKPVNWPLLDHYLRFVYRASRNEVAARQAQVEVEALARTKDNMLAVVRHEMKTPLSAIVGFTRLAAEAQAKGDVSLLKEQLGFVQESGERLLACFSDMTIFSDLISGRVQPALDQAAPGWLLDEAMEHRQAQAQRAGVRILLAPGAPDWRIAVDQPLMVSALVRLIDNCLRHAEGLTTIELEAGRGPEGQIVLRIIDDGAGMDPERIPACLAPFSQENMSLARAKEGLGLGLPIAREIARLHGGDLAMTTRPGTGTRVEIMLPENGSPLRDR
ncbi:MAG: hybrid sensor histidine kinase/response regulator [Proteobacteria bacterium]|nr:hybrid sensor histidine kinase/response regulator [Pseudomonadota bacterium]